MVSFSSKADPIKGKHTWVSGARRRQGEAGAEIATPV